MHALETIVRLNAESAEQARIAIAALQARNAEPIGDTRAERLAQWASDGKPVNREVHVHWEPVPPVAIENNWDSSDYTYRDGSRFWEVLTLSQAPCGIDGGHNGAIVVTCEDSRDGLGIRVVATIPLDNRLADVPLVRLWTDDSVPQCVKLETELRHSQARRNSIGG
jgi:hypothetical protein